MGLPTLKKTWEFHHTAVNGPAELYLWTIKDTLLNMTDSPWTVHASCGKNGGAVLVADLTDNWLTVADLDGNSTGPYSWIVLTNSTTGSQLVLSMRSSSEENCSFYYSPSGDYASTGFDTETLPASADYIGMGYRYGWGSSDTGWQHVMQSTDGTCLRIFPTRVDRAYDYDGKAHPTGWIMFDEVHDAPSTWEPPRAVAAAFGNTSQGSDYLIYTNWSSNTARIYGRVNGLHTSLFAGSEWTTTSIFGLEIHNNSDLDPNTRVCTAMLLMAVDAQEEGYRGQMTDLWWGQRLGNQGGTVKPPVTGTMYGDGEFVQMADMIFPWDGWTQLGD